MNNAGNTPLHEALKHCRTAVALKLLDAEPNSHGWLNSTAESPLHVAARKGLLYVVVKKILDVPTVDVWRAPTTSGTALHQAVLGGHTGIVELLLETRSWLTEETDTFQNNALHYAAERNKAPIVTILLKKNIWLAHMKKREMQSPLHVATRCDSPETIIELLAQCPDTAETVDGSERNAFHIAVWNDKVMALKCLLSYERSKEIVNRVDKDGNTPLHLAVKFGRQQSSLLLLGDRRVDPCLLNRDGQTARSLIESQEQVPSYMIHVWKELMKQEHSKCKNKLVPPVRTPDWWREFNRYVELRMGTYTLVATLIATVTFSYTFTMPGGYDQQFGTAILGNHTAFKVCVIANTLAMLSSIIVVFGFIWSRREAQDFKTSQVAWSHWLTVIACLAMVVSLTTAVYLTVVAKSPWLAYFVIAMGCSTPVVMVVMLGEDVFTTPV